MLKKYSKIVFLIVLVIYAGIIYYTNFTTPSLIRSQVSEEYNFKARKAVEAIGASDMDYLLNNFELGSVPESDFKSTILAMQKMVVKRPISQMSPISYQARSENGNLVAIINYDIEFAQDQRVLGTFVFKDSKDTKNILGFNFTEGLPLVEKYSLFSSDLTLSSYVLGFAFLIVFLVIVYAVSLIIIEKPKGWVWWLIFAGCIGFVGFQANWHTGEWDYKILHPSFGIPLIVYWKSAVTPLTLQFTIPVGAICYLLFGRKSSKVSRSVFEEA